ncbi:Nif3-like dinuclear metal center hexameric protein [Staphylococcus intermedius]|uniref:Nif3-like dinuclear metal center hexameric protein n=1 Tax=Staphylococcus intermedius TaxID=1285 RepID=UPI000BBC17DA|nr:Nif3-like dinuclear metal center hexameric protein [Staphylococcus intermedius]PCF64802.1 Nif3-like dinuclear metal center hexameric protein [Staphylococcus intermedius]PCF80412.1 Nif3-like dinuclear metal center hexameric protein [Staphylococcus intermedius]PCF81762.1 Nif3-like dinuclear metal center hexameric protein [Staphylococcus intermedius]
MKLHELLSILNQEVPFHTAESWDNVGLLIGDKQSEVNGILTTLDCTLEVVEEAINQNINTIIAHHPLIFKGVKSITEDGGYGSILYRLIQNKMNLIALHTNLDVHPKGVNAMLADKIGLKHYEVLDRQATSYLKVQVFIPKANVKTFKDTLAEHGLATEGNYEYCFFNTDGEGQFKPVEKANPHIGQIGDIETVNELKIEFMIHSGQMTFVQQLIEDNHPYETPVYDFIPMKKMSQYGLGMIGELPETQSVESFVQSVKQALHMPSVRYIGDPKATIQRVAIIGGAGIGFENLAHQRGADLFITGDIKHHEALDAKTAGINLLDINHYSEYVMKEGLITLLEDWLAEAGATIPMKASSVHTDPYDYM